MKLLIKKIIVLLLIFNILISLYSTTVFATEESTNPETLGISEDASSSTIELNSEAAILIEASSRKCFI